MSPTTPYEHRGRDLDTREEVTEFVVRFYREIAQDDRFHHYFDTIAHVDWHAHTLDLADFWTGVLIGESDRSAGDVIEAHRWLHDTDPFDRALFDRWLEILDTTLDEGWTGPFAHRARQRGHGFAWAMAKRFAGLDLNDRDGPADSERVGLVRRSRTAAANGLRRTIEETGGPGFPIAPDRGRDRR